MFGGGGFGAPAASSNPFGAAPAPAFGAPQAAPGAFGAPAQTGFGAPAGSTGTPNGDYDVPNPPEDGISCLRWSVNNHLAVGSWDKTCRIYEVKMNQGGFGGGQIQAGLVATVTHEAPVLCCDFNDDGTIIFTGTCDNKIKMKNLSANTEQIIGQHDAPVKEVFWCKEMKMVISASWDKTVRFWTGQSATPAATLNLPERVYSADLAYPVFIVALAERKFLIYNLEQIRTSTTPVKSGETALKMQTRVVRCFPDKTGYAVGSIEGRCSIGYIQETTKNFAFKCHRSNDEIFAINSIAFHPTLGTFATAGADGFFTFWDKDNRQRLKQFNNAGGPITAVGFNPSGHIFAYAVSYDWSKGHECNVEGIPRKIYLHKVEESEVKPKPVARSSTVGGRR